MMVIFRMETEIAELAYYPTHSGHGVRPRPGGGGGPLHSDPHGGGAIPPVY
jgi:hypothetical protein